MVTWQQSEPLRHTLGTEWVLQHLLILLPPLEQICCNLFFVARGSGTLLAATFEAAGCLSCCRISLAVCVLPQRSCCCCQPGIVVIIMLPTSPSALRPTGEEGGAVASDGHGIILCCLPPPEAVSCESCLKQRAAAAAAAALRYHWQVATCYWRSVVVTQSLQ
jgi:hypothetical protein